MHAFDRRDMPKVRVQFRPQELRLLGQGACLVVPWVPEDFLHLGSASGRRPQFMLQTLS